MTHDQTVLCARCGFANAPGDQFCGSCGTFLEWEGAPAGGAADPGAPGPAPVASAPAAGPGPTVAPANAGSNASSRSRVIEKPVASSGASARSARPCAQIW